MIGLLNHLTVVEKSWFEEIVAGREIDYRYDFDEDWEAERHLTGDETVADAIAQYEAQVAISNEIVAESDITAKAQKEVRGENCSLRWIVVHVIEETARHARHADVLREHLDGTLGYLPYPVQEPPSRPHEVEAGHVQDPFRPTPVQRHVMPGQDSSWSGGSERPHRQNHPSAHDAKQPDFQQSLIDR